MKLELYRTAADVKSGNKLHTMELHPFIDSVQTVTLEPREMDEVPEPDTEEPAEDDNAPVTKPSRPQGNPWYDLTIQAADGSTVFRGWYGVLQYPRGSPLDLGILDRGVTGDAGGQLRAP